MSLAKAESKHMTKRQLALLDAKTEYKKQKYAATACYCAAQELYLFIVFFADNDMKNKSANAMSNTKPNSWKRKILRKFSFHKQFLIENSAHSSPTPHAGFELLCCSKEQKLADALAEWSEEFLTELKRWAKATPYSDYDDAVFEKNPEVPDTLNSTRNFFNVQTEQLANQFAAVLSGLPGNFKKNSNDILILPRYQNTPINLYEALRVVLLDELYEVLQEYFNYDLQRLAIPDAEYEIHRFARLVSQEY